MKKLSTYNGFGLTYFVFGSGEKTVVCFPGYGRSGRDYEPLARILEDHKVIAINYFFLDESHYPPERLDSNQLRKDEHREHIRDILNKEGVNNFSFLAYSMGARLSLCILEDADWDCDHIVFMAPDGIRISKWHRFTGSGFGKWLYRGLVLKRPKTFFKLVNVFRRLRILKPSMVKFLKFHLDTHEKREMVHNVWLSSNKLIPDHSTLRNQDRTYHLILGKFDKIITTETADHFRKNISESVDVRLAEAGHDLMKPEVFKELYTILD